jgi:hypothetical protein
MAIPLVKTVKYERPRGDHDQDVVWEFVTTTDIDLPHGHPTFDGQLRKTTTGWQARHYQHTRWGFGYTTRKAAIQDIVPAVIESMRKQN